MRSHPRLWFKVKCPQAPPSTSPNAKASPSYLQGARAGIRPQKTTFYSPAMRTHPLGASFSLPDHPSLACQRWAIPTHLEGLHILEHAQQSLHADLSPPLSSPSLQPACLVKIMIRNLISEHPLTCISSACGFQSRVKGAGTEDSSRTVLWLQSPYSPSNGWMRTTR